MALVAATPAVLLADLVNLVSLDRTREGSFSTYSFQVIQGRVCVILCQVVALLSPLSENELYMVLL